MEQIKQHELKLNEIEPKFKAFQEDLEGAIAKDKAVHPIKDVLSLLELEEEVLVESYEAVLSVPKDD